MFRSIRYKLIVFLLLATVLPLGISIVITYVYTKESVKNRSIASTYEVIAKGKNDVETYFTDITKIPLTIYQNRQFLQILENGASSLIDENQPEITRSLLGLFSTRSEIQQVHLYIDKDKADYAVYNLKVSSRGRLETSSYFQKLVQSRRYFQIEPTHMIYSYNRLSTIPANRRVPVISFHHNISNVTSNQPLALISIDIDLLRLQAIMERLYDKRVEELYLIAPDGTIAYASDETKIGTKNEMAWYKQAMASKQNNMEWEDRHFQGVIVHDTFTGDFEGWQLVKRTPYQSLYQPARELVFITLGIGVISLIFIIVMTIVISFHLTAPIQVLVANMQRVEAGDWEVDFSELKNDEFGKMGEHFTSMMNTINELIVREYKLELENKSNQLRVLQSQINPHFLYNALQSIGTLSLVSNAPDVYKLLTSLSNMMRYSMHIDEELVTVKQEVAHIQAYLKLQKQRFGDRLSYEVEVDSELLGSPMPKMLLQPIVENFFKHSFEDLEPGGSIIVRIQRHGNDMEVVICDNGHGVTPERLERIKKKLVGDEKIHEGRRDSIGLKNIYDRLYLYYGMKMNMDISNETTGGFCVTLRIPV